MPFEARGWWLASVGRGLLRSHMAELSVRFARLAGGSAITVTGEGGLFVYVRCYGVKCQARGFDSCVKQRHHDGGTFDRYPLALSLAGQIKGNFYTEGWNSNGIFSTVVVC